MIIQGSLCRIASRAQRVSLYICTYGLPIKKKITRIARTYDLPLCTATLFY
ncbi:hypothetical protein HanRHA438_Chr05g0238851 [Helianthus annuus]|nr:hypothetical protein HanRHA438_Chr05g0238851 [Helianthus annuus]